MREIVNQLRQGDDSTETLTALARAWRNTSHTLRPCALQRLHRLALTVSRPMLDIGSGLSTLIMAIAAEKTGIPVLALESDKAYQCSLVSILDALDVKTATVLFAPICHGWYSLPDDLPESFGLVLVDGPQHLENRGLAYERLAARIEAAHIIADDLLHEPIAAPFNRWTLSTGRIAERCGGYAIARAL